jgi:hypothetical protein
VISKRTRIIYTQCDLDTYESDYDTHEFDYDTHEFDLYTHELNFNTMRVTFITIYTYKPEYKPTLQAHANSHPHACRINTLCGIVTVPYCVLI